MVCGGVGGGGVVLGNKPEAAVYLVRPVGR